MLGIGFGEIVIIGTIGLIVVGPQRLPETARFLGHLFNRIQRQVNMVKADIRREIALEEMKNIHREYEETTRSMKNAFDQAATGVPPPDFQLGDDASADGAPAAKSASSTANTPRE